MAEHAREASAPDAETFWEDHYGARERVWSGRVNPVLAEVAAALPPGRALDLGCGEGGDAIWLAGRGWRVTAVDVSATALARLSARAAETGLRDRIEVARHDLTRTVPTGPFDLVSAQYLQSPLEFPRVGALQAAARALVPGGLLLVVDHGSAPPWAGHHRDRGSAPPSVWHHHEHHRFPAPAEVLAELELDPATWTTVRLDAPQREAIGPDGQTGTLTDVVVAVRRTPGPG